MSGDFPEGINQDFGFRGHAGRRKQESAGLEGAQVLPGSASRKNGNMLVKKAQDAKRAKNSLSKSRVRSPEQSLKP